ncbi:putative porin [Mucilaginibacter sp. L3T2-6]|uniref:putative porin n=1 Tax=Mucilaginibacter sp. L3T2-6 TaxID=3062491 RepID=UPI00267607C8|nr:putative porin [Mucilaginibacter sp. L3T2-6]MDO3644791.1 putative porin [Mucilaginibacter sp. L3T2-6]MDV6217315.1 putative porin [Mucilaginibacter sp. L3T2-6]
MPHKVFKYLLLLFICVFAQSVFAQIQRGNNNYPGSQQRINLRDTGTTQKTLTTDQQLDSLRKKQDRKKDSVVFNAKFIRVTNERFLRDSTVLFPLDTGLYNYENYSPLLQPRTPKISLGNTGLPARPLLFEPSRTIGFEPGLHELDPYMLRPENINYYRARVAMTNLYLVGYTGVKEQLFKITHTQNVNPRLNVGFNLNFIGSRGYYAYNGVLAQNVSDVNAAVFTWYESKSKRYNLLSNLIYNNLKTPITGSILNDSVFSVGSLNKGSEQVRMPAAYDSWKGGSFYLKQFYYIGHIDSTSNGKNKPTILPTQRVAVTVRYDATKYEFRQNGVDTYNIFPDYYYSYDRSHDSLMFRHLQNDFSYSFYLRSKSEKAVKNELKLDLGLTQDVYSYGQFVSDTVLDVYGAKIVHPVKVQGNLFQDLTVKGKLSYKLSNRALLEGDVQQIVQGHDFGDFLYDAKLTLAGNNKTGKIVLEGYSQSATPPLVFTSWNTNHFIFHNQFNKQKTNSLSFNYVNGPLKFDLKAEYFLISDYLYFTAQENGIDAHPAQLGSPINLIKISVGKSIAWRRWHFDDYLVFQKTDYQSTLRTPQFYNYASLYYKALLFNVLYSNIGLDVRYNTPYVAPSYAPGLGQFYNGANVTFSSYPVATVFIKATLQRTNFFVMYDYANQGLFSKGYYTVNRYPQQDAMVKIGVSWTFYN